MSEPQRIVSLIPSTTEITAALGMADALVGRSHECDYPPSVEALPVLTAARFDDGSSREIDDRVKELVERALSVYDVDAALLRELEPTLILTQDQCEVCAASLSDVEDAVGEWVGAKPAIVSLSPATLADVWRDIERIGASLGVPERAAAVVAGLTARLTAIGEISGALDRPSVACIEWFDPLMTGGNWMPELVALAGGDNLFGQPGAHSPWLEWDALGQADPDILLLIPCGFDLERNRAELPALQANPAWNTLRAVQQGKVFATDGNAYFNRPGPRLVESAEILAEILHPDQFHFGHEGIGWQRLRGER
jgi:iron complex transport system substrate-binding protein